MYPFGLLLVEERQK